MHINIDFRGAQAVAAAVACAIADASFEEIWEAAMAPIPEDTWFRASMLKAREIVETAEGDLFRAWMPLHDELWTSYKACVSEAVSAAFGVLLLSHDSFRTGVTVAGNFGRDADTIGAIAGSILGGMYGASSIPAGWADKTRYPTGTCLLFTKGIDILSVADQLTDLILADA